MSGRPEHTVFEFLGYRLDPAGRRLTGPDGQLVPLRPRVFDTLCYLVRHAGQPVAKSDLMAAVWPGAVVEENNLNQAISILRQTFEDDHRDPSFIATITGRGYQFVAPVGTETPVAAGQGGEGPARPWVTWAAGFLALAAVIVLAFIGVRTRAPGPEPDARTESVPELDGARMVTPFSGSHSSPTLSPDGTLMAFVSDRSGMTQVWVMGLPDGVPAQLTHGPLPASSPSWSPASDDILFQRAAPGGLQSVWITDALGSGSPRLLVEDAIEPAFSTDGQSFVFTRGPGEIYIASLNGEYRRLEGIPHTGGFARAMPALNAHGDVAFVLADEGPVGNLWVYAAGEGAARQLTRSQGPLPGVLAEGPAWLPDGRSVVYSAADGDLANLHLWKTDAVTGNTMKLTTGAGGYGEPAFSRDGSSMAYSFARPLWRLVETDPETGENRILHQSGSPVALPVVSADGETAVYFGEHVWTLPLDGGEPSQVTFDEPGEATLPTWSRTESVVYYYRNRALHRIDPETRMSETVLEDFHWSSKNWLAVAGNRLAYQVRDPSAGSGETVIRDLETGETLVLGERVLPTDWSRDEQVLLARRASDSALVTCAAPDFDCSAVMDDGEPVRGAIPRWSADETRIFFRRARGDRPGHAEIWVVPREGGPPGRVAEIGPYQPSSMYFGVTRDDRIVWNQYDSRGISEIWTSGGRGQSGR